MADFIEEEFDINYFNDLIHAKACMKAYILYKDSEHNTMVLRVYNDGCYKDILVKPTRLDNIFVTVGDNIEHSEIYTIFELVDISINC